MNDARQRVDTLASNDGSTSLLGRLGGWSYSHRRRVVLIWLLILVAFSAAGRSAGSQFKTDITGGHTESQRASTFLHGQFPAQAGDTAQVVLLTSAPVTAAVNQSKVEALVASLRGLPHVESVRGPFEVGAVQQLSRDGRTAVVVVQFDARGDAIPGTAVHKVVHQALDAASPGFKIELGGSPVQKIENPKFGTSEGLGLLAAIVILLLAFGSFIAMAIPIVIALMAVATTFGILDLLSRWLTVPNFGPELAALIGLAVGIDYALFMVTRYRDELRSGVPPADAVRTSVAISGRAIVFAGSTVVLSLLGLFLLGLPFIYGAALGTIVAVVLILMASLTLLPALLGFAGVNIDKYRIRRAGRDVDAAGRTGFWRRWSRQVQRRPWITGGAAAVVLVVLALPFLSLRLAFTDAGTGPTSFQTRQAYDSISAAFGPGTNGPLVVALRLAGNSDRGVAARVDERLAAEPNIARVSPPLFNPAGTAAVITVVPDTSPQDARTADLVHVLRSRVLPSATAGTDVRALVGGETAGSIDTSNLISRHLAAVLGFVILLSIVLLARAFRSFLVPIASAAMTLLSTGVAYGVVVAVFQWGWLGSGIDNGATAPVDPWVPVMLFTILFGLSMDYQVFLVSRIREERARGVNDSQAVANGLASTGRVITSAAAIMVCVFAAFVLGDLRVLRLFGVGMATAILLDATLVRMVLMPSSMELLGSASWWFPGRRHPMPDAVPPSSPDLVGAVGD